jgi:hypothetical protein
MEHISSESDLSSITLIQYSQYINYIWKSFWNTLLTHFSNTHNIKFLCLGHGGHGTLHKYHHHPSGVTLVSLFHNHKFYQITTLVNNYSWSLRNLQTRWHGSCCPLVVADDPFQVLSFRLLCKVFMTWAVDRLSLLSPACHGCLTSYPTLTYLRALCAISTFLVSGRAVLHMHLFSCCQIMQEGMLCYILLSVIKV